MAQIILWGGTAIEWYGQAIAVPGKVVDLAGVSADDVRPVPKTTSYLGELYPPFAQPYHIAVFHRDNRRRLQGICCHVVPDCLREVPHYLAASGVLLPPPELALVQQSRARSVIEVIVEATVLCSAYAIGPGNELQERSPVATPERIAAACCRHHAAFGCNTLRRAEGWIMPNAASPREVALALVLCLPCRLGGYGLPKAMLNVALSLPKRIRDASAAAYYVADLCWPDSRLVIEYDSDEYHLTPQQQHRDAVKRMVLEEMGYRVLTVTKRQLNDPREMDKVARVVSSILHRQFRIRCRDFRTRQFELWRAVGLPVSAWPFIRKVR